LRAKLVSGSKSTAIFRWEGNPDRVGEFTVTMREEDLFRGFLLNAANRNARPLLIAVLALVTLIVVLLALSPSSRHAMVYNAAYLLLEGALLLAALLLGLVLAFRRPILRSMARRTLEQRRELATPVRWAFDDDSLRIETRFTRSAFPWDALRGWREDRHVLLVYLSDQLFHAVPKDQVEEAQSGALRSALESHGVPRR
jgi:hypothetical protein